MLTVFQIDQEGCFVSSGRIGNRETSVYQIKNYKHVFTWTTSQLQVMLSV